MKAKTTRAPKIAILKRPSNLSNIVPFNSAQRAAQIADQRAANKTLDEFVLLVKEHGCHSVTLMAYLPNGNVISGFSHRSSDDGLSEVPCPSVKMKVGAA